MAEKTPQVAFGKAGAARIELKGVFRYFTKQEKLSPNKIKIGFSAAAIGILTLLVAGPPPSDTSTGSSTTPIPNTSSREAATSPGFDTYSRESDARSFDRRTVHLSSKSGPVRYLGPQLVLRAPKIKVPQGTIAKATLISGASDGIVRARFSQIENNSDESSLESGTILLGKGTTTGERLKIHFDRAILPDGQTGAIQAEALDASDRIAGLRGSKLGAGALRLATGIGLNFLSGVSEGLQTSHGEQGVAVKDPSLKNALLQGTARASLSQSQEIMNELHNSKPTIAVPSGSEILVIFLEGDGSDGK